MNSREAESNPLLEQSTILFFGSKSQTEPTFSAKTIEKRVKSFIMSEEFILFEFLGSSESSLSTELDAELFKFGDSACGFLSDTRN